jgi:hypothetical protein
MSLTTHCGLHPCTASGLPASRPRHQASESGIGAAIARPAPNEGIFPLCRLLVLLKKNAPFGSFPVSPYLGTFRRLLWAFYRKLLSASYGVLLCQPQNAPDRMLRLSDKLDCNSSATAVVGDTSPCSVHTCGIRHANFFSFSLQ